MAFVLSEVFLSILRTFNNTIKEDKFNVIEYVYYIFSLTSYINCDVCKKHMKIKRLVNMTEFCNETKYQNFLMRSPRKGQMWIGD